MKNKIPPAVIPELGQNIANTIRYLSADAVQKANSGHPGMPMGCADIATVLLTRFLRIDPNDPNWFNRDRFILSAGHGSMLLYSMLHLAGFLSLDDLKEFRQYGSRTPGHPEVGDVPGVDATAGPLGAGFANAVGMTMAERLLAERYNRPGCDVVDHFTYVIMGDGCNMEGLTQEAASLAGHLKLGKLIAFYDDNEISIEGDTSLAFTENVNARYEANEWHVQDIDGHDHEAIAQAVINAQKVTDKPSLIVAHTTIGKGAPSLAGSEASHGAPLGEQEIIEAKKAIGWSGDTFQVPADVTEYFENRKKQWTQIREDYNTIFTAYQQGHADAAGELTRIIEGKLPEGWKNATPHYDACEKGIATRAAGGKVLNAFAEVIDELVGGSADLAPSCKTEINSGNWAEYMAPGSYAGRNIHFGVREHAMGNIVNGLTMHGLVGFGSTFMVFHDYMRPAVRLAALQHTGSISVYTHDSFYVGEDGPTHQPIEQLAAMRAIPRLHVLRPCDANETAYAWQHMIARRNLPSTIALTRQNLPILDRNTYAPAEGVLRGGYVLQDEDGAEMIFVASGSEVHLAIETANKLRERYGKKIRIVSMPCLDLFREQSWEYQNEVLPGTIDQRVVMEAGIRQGWEGILGWYGLFVGMEDFGVSGPCGTLARKFGFTADSCIEKILRAGF